MKCRVHNIEEDDGYLCNDNDNMTHGFSSNEEVEEGVKKVGDEIWGGMKQDKNQNMVSWKEQSNDRIEGTMGQSSRR